MAEQAVADPVADLLRMSPLTQTQRKLAWDAFDETQDADALAVRIKDLALPQAVKAKLWDLKEQQAPPDFTTTNQTDASGHATAIDWNPLSSGNLQTAYDRSGVSSLVEVGKGAIKGAGQTAVNVGKLWQKVPGFTAGVDALYGLPGLSKGATTEADRLLTPTNLSQKVGKVGEQIGEILVPGTKIATLGEIAASKFAPRLAPVVGRAAARFIPKAVVEGAGGAAMSAAQGGDPRIGAVAGMVAPALSAAVDAAPATLKEAALKKVVQALGPTKERFKAIAERLAPQMLARGLGGSRESLQTHAAEMLQTVGDDLDTALQSFAAQRVGTGPVVQALETAKDAFRTTAASGAVVVFEPRAVAQLTGLQKIVADLGPDASVQQLVAVRRAWDKVVDQAGGFAHRAGGAIGVPLKDQSEAWAKREATSAIRDVLATDVPELAAINKEWSFWKNLDDVLQQTLKRTQPHGVGVGRLMAEGAGQVVGASLGAPAGPAGTIGGAFALGKVASMAKAAFTSPRWRLVDARLRNALADAIAANDVSQIATALGRISAVEGSKVGQ